MSALSKNAARLGGIFIAIQESSGLYALNHRRSQDTSPHVFVAQALRMEP
jgi:hypothetical protein